MVNLEEKKERHLLVGVNLKKDDQDTQELMLELEELDRAAGAIPVKIITQSRDSYDSRTVLGKGKVEEIADLVNHLEIDAVVFNDELSGSQLRNLEEIIGCKILDRTTLILDIFASRARSKEGQYQVKLAQMKYRLPRIIGYSDYLSRTGGGIGTRGPGEQKLETDRRHVLREIRAVEQQLLKIETTRQTNRKKRQGQTIPIIALVGYTNTGKSTILNRMLELSGDETPKYVLAQDMLFATLDASLRTMKLNQTLPVIVSDTVGFVSQLPTHLVNAFKSTLEELYDADLIVHVLDASSDNVTLQAQTTEKILDDMGVLDKKILTVFNKMDLKENRDSVLYSQQFEDRIFISALNDDDMKRLIDKMVLLVTEDYKQTEFKFPFESMKYFDYFANRYDLENVVYDEFGVTFRTFVNQEDRQRFKEYINHESSIN
ncbi:GTPase HflX [Erysipelothrix inopinata]|uniref:GTPase HflX n=1 Tax=Erysipelothrix inopinata TaxID=225084 RepID=A0A7G9RZG8_9FIRM|nr:GTPase HflX [Erysipelothrix inopinata]QNN60993.1 GTPase HflX [Erysipelothrix inopinata]